MPPTLRRQTEPPSTPACRRILAAAEACFGNLGFQKTSVTEIAIAAQVSKPLVYRYFESKEHLYEAVVRRVVNAWNEELVVALFASSDDVGASGDVADALRNMHRTSLDFARQSPLLQGLLARDSRMMLAAYSDVVERSMSTWRQQVHQRLEAGIASGEVRADIPVAAVADAVTELHLAYAERVVAGRDSAADTRNAEAAFECLLHGICSAAPPSAA